MPVSMEASCVWLWLGRSWVLVVLCAVHSSAHGGGLQAQRLQKFVGLIQPSQLHLAFGDTAQDIVVMWATMKDAKFSIEFAETAHNMQKIEAEKAVLEESNSRAAKYLYRVYLAKLKPGEIYVYRIVGDSGANSNIFSFKVPETAPKRIHSFMVIADIGLSSKSLQFLTYEVASHMAYEAVFHVGDIAYNLHRDEGSFGDHFLKYIEKFTAKVPYMTVPGDHERFHDFAHYRHRFSMPRTAWPMPSDKLWYSINIGPVCFITINTEVFYTQTHNMQAQLDWLHDQLYTANVQREQHPWVIVLGHRPMYCSPSDTDDQMEDQGVECDPHKPNPLRSKLEDLFFEEGVDLYISGHRHNYERSWPVYRGKVFQQGYRDLKAPVHIINGAMGYAYLTETISKPETWSAFSTSDPEKELYGRLQVLNSSHLMWDVFAASNNELIDSILVIQYGHGSYGKAGDDAYKKMIEIQKLPPAPFHWKPNKEKEQTIPVFHDVYSLPPSTRKLYLMTMCCSLLGILVAVLCVPKVRRRVCRLAR